MATMAIIILWLVQIALFVGSWLSPWRDAPERKTNGRLPVQARMLLSFSLVVAALVIALQPYQGAPVYSRWVLLGMVASFVGDLVMAKLIPVPNRLIGGMVAFGIAHALYITAYNRTISMISSLEPYSRFHTGLIVGLVIYGLITVLGWWFLIRSPQKGLVVNLGALVYGLWISVMASFALALGYALGFWLTAIGGLLFVASDFIIGATGIRGIQVKNANDWVWLTYVAGQMGIIYAGWLV
jgi:hypothetical protein